MMEKKECITIPTETNHSRRQRKGKLPFLKETHNVKSGVHSCKFKHSKCNSLGKSTFFF